MDDFRSAAGCLAKFLAGLCTLAFVGMAILSVSAVFGVAPFLKADLYKQVLRRQHFYARVPALMAAQVIYTFDQKGNARIEGVPVDLMALSAEEWEAIIVELMPPDWFQQQVERNLDEVFASFYQQPYQEPALEISLVEVKMRLAGEPGYRVFMRLLDSLPPCDPAQWALLAQSATALAPGDIPLCRPPDELVAAGEPQIRQLLAQVAGRLPDTYDLSQPSAQTASQPAAPSGTQSFDDLRWLLRNFSTLSWGGLLGALFLLGGIALLAVRSLRGGLLWWGLPLLAAGLLGTGTMLVIWFLYRQAVVQSGTLSISGLAPVWVDTLFSLLNTIAQTPMLTTGLVFVALAVTGFGMAALSFFIPRNEPQEIYLPYR